jgi:hypothetical protein
MRLSKTLTFVILAIGLASAMADLLSGRAQSLESNLQGRANLGPQGVENPNFMEEAWVKDNGHATSGIIRIRHFDGLPRQYLPLSAASPSRAIKDGCFEWRVFLGRAVIGYDLRVQTERMKGFRDSAGWDEPFCRCFFMVYLTQENDPRIEGLLTDGTSLYIRRGDQWDLRFNKETHRLERGTFNETIKRVTRPVEPEMVFVPAGDYVMGTDDLNGWTAERPTHRVNISGFYVSKHLIDKLEYQPFMRATGRDEPATGSETSYVVKWSDAEAYCKWLSEMTGKHYRLPTEAEWEKAVCASPGLKDVDEGEWVLDWFDENYYSHSPEKDPQGPPCGVPGFEETLEGRQVCTGYRVVRGVQTPAEQWVPSCKKRLYGFPEQERESFRVVLAE